MDTTLRRGKRRVEAGDTYAASALGRDLRRRYGEPDPTSLTIDARPACEGKADLKAWQNDPGPYGMRRAVFEQATPFGVPVVLLVRGAGRAELPGGALFFAAVRNLLNDPKHCRAFWGYTEAREFLLDTEDPLWTASASMLLSLIDRTLNMEVPW